MSVAPFLFKGDSMAQYDGSIRINTEINTNGIRAGEREIRGSMDRISSAAKKIAGIIGAAFAIGKLVQFGKEAIELGSDLEEVQNVVDVTFTTMSEKVNEFAKNAAVSAGLSETMAKRYVGTFGAMSKSFGFAEGEAYKMSTALTQLSGDVASFYNISQDEAYIKLKSVFTGETETLKDLGVVMTQAALDQYALANGFGKTTSKMTEQEKVALRYQFVMDQLAGASGDFIRTSDSWANQTRILKLQVESLMATIGQGLINIFTPAIKAINILLGKLATAANAFKSFTELITGKKSSSGSGGGAGAAIIGDKLGDSVEGYNEAADAADNLAGSTEKVADATKDAKKAAEGYLNPLDEINKYKKVEQDSGLPGIESGGLGGIENIDYGELAEGESVLDNVGESTNALIEKLKELRGIFKKGFFDGLGDWEYRWESIKDSIASIKDSLVDIWTDPKVLKAADRWAQSVAYLLGSIVGSVASVGLTIATNLLGGIAKYLEQNKERIKEYLVSIFDIWSDINDLLSSFFQSFAYVFEAFASENGQQLTANLIEIFTDAFMGVTEISSKLIRDILNIFIQPFVDNKEAFRTALEGFLGVLATVAGTIKDAIDDTFDKLNGVYDEHFKPFFDSIAQGLSDLVEKFMSFWNEYVQPILNKMAEDFDELWKSHIQPFINNGIELIGKVIDVLKVLWENVLQPFIAWFIQNILPVVLPVIQSIWDRLVIFVSFVADAANNIVTVLSGIIDFLLGIFTGDWERAFGGIKSIVEGVLGQISNIITMVLDSIGNSIDYALSAITGIIEAVVSIIKGIVESSSKHVRDVVLGGLKSAKESFGKFKEDLGELWHDTWSSLGDTVKSIIETIKNTIGEFFDWVSDKVSGIIDSINSIGKKSSITRTAGNRFLSSRFSTFRSAPTMPYASPAFDALRTAPIPKLATGAVIPANKEFLAVLGDQKHGTNIEAPLDTIKQANEEAVLNVLSKLGMSGGNIGGTPVNIILQVTLDGQVLGQKMVDWGKLQQMATGNNPYNLGTA